MTEGHFSDHVCKGYTACHNCRTKIRKGDACLAWTTWFGKLDFTVCGNECRWALEYRHHSEKIAQMLNVTRPEYNEFLYT